MEYLKVNSIKQKRRTPKTLKRVMEIVSMSDAPLKDEYSQSDP